MKVSFLYSLFVNRLNGTNQLCCGLPWFQECCHAQLRRDLGRNPFINLVLRGRHRRCIEGLSLGEGHRIDALFNCLCAQSVAPLPRLHLRFAKDD